MATQAQIEANRENAQKSTGPRTAEGKAVSSKNAVKYGLFAKETVISGENQADYDAFYDAALAELAPSGAMEAILAERNVANVLTRGQHRNDDLRRRGHLARHGRDRHAGMRFGEALGFRTIDVEHGQLVAGARKMGSHRRAHHPESDEAYSHDLSLVRRASDRRPGA